MVAVNDHGSGEESVRIVFRTASNNIKDIKEVCKVFGVTFKEIKWSVKSLGSRSRKSSGQ